MPREYEPSLEFLDVRDESTGLPERREANDIWNNSVEKLGHTNDKFRDKIKLVSAHHRASKGSRPMTAERSSRGVEVQSLPIFRPGT